MISQGDDAFGKPTARAELCQDGLGQAGYRGWILFPVQSNGDVTGAFRYAKDKLVTVRLADVSSAIVARSPYNRRARARATPRDRSPRPA